MPMPPNYEKMGSALLIEALLAAQAERALLTYDEAPIEELKVCQRKLDTITEEILRRMSW